MIHEHDRGVLTAPLPEEGLEAGDIGTVVHIYPRAEAYEIEFEFVTLTGQTAAVVTVPAEKVRTHGSWCITEIARRNLIAVRFSCAGILPRSHAQLPLMTVFFKMGIAASLTFTAFAAEKPLAAMRLPLTAKTVATPKVKIVFAGEPTTAVRACADEAAHVVIEWWPQVAHLLSTDDFHSPEQLTLTFKKELKGPAHRTTDGLFISIPWITAHPDDFGMIIHEMTHAIQDYHGAPRDAGWLVEGIADNIRYWQHEPEVPHRRIDSTKASYRDGYSTTGAFLAWNMVKYDRRTVRASTPHFARENTPTRFLRRSTARRWMHFGPSSLRANIHTNLSKKLNLEARKPRRDRANISAFLASWLPNPAAMMRSTTQHPIFPPHS